MLDSLKFSTDEKPAKIVMKRLNFMFAKQNESLENDFLCRNNHHDFFCNVYRVLLLYKGIIMGRVGNKGQNKCIFGTKIGTQQRHVRDK